MYIYTYSHTYINICIKRYIYIWINIYVCMYHLCMWVYKYACMYPHATYAHCHHMLIHIFKYISYICIWISLFFNFLFVVVLRLRSIKPEMLFVMEIRKKEQNAFMHAVVHTYIRTCVCTLIKQQLMPTRVRNAHYVCKRLQNASTYIHTYTNK